MKRWLTLALVGLVLSCQGPAAVLAREHKAAEFCVLIEHGRPGPAYLDSVRR